MPIITMPKLSDTMVEGTIARWKKKQGDTIEMGDILAEVETDKATMEMEAFDEGVLKEIYVGDGGVAKVGEKVALILGEGETAEAASGGSRSEGGLDHCGQACGGSGGSRPGGSSAAGCSRALASRPRRWPKRLPQNAASDLNRSKAPVRVDESWQPTFREKRLLRLRLLPPRHPLPRFRLRLRERPTSASRSPVCVA